MRAVADLTVFENNIIDEIVFFDSDQTKNQELLCCVSVDGEKEIARAFGTVSQVKLPAETDELRKAGEGIRLFHNHPTEGSLSDEDWWQSLHWKGKADVIAINKERTIFCGAAKELTALDALLDRVDLREIRRCGEEELFTAKCPTGKQMIKPFARHLVSHVLNLELKEMGLVYYDYLLSRRDRDIYDELLDLGLWDAVSNRMRSMF